MTKNRFWNRIKSWLFWLNFLIVQWFFVRFGRKYSHKHKKFISWGFVGLILPLTGWWNNYIWIWKIKKNVRSKKSLNGNEILGIEEE